jgi:hypothetical protein
VADWKDLTRLSGGARLIVERVAVPELGIALEGSFELPPLARLPADEQVFIAAFVKSHGSIKEMERLFGVSYPTVKNRLHKLAQLLDPELSVDAPQSSPEPASVERAEILARLESGAITVREALEALKR